MDVGEEWDWIFLGDDVVGGRLLLVEHICLPIYIYM